MASYKDQIIDILTLLQVEADAHRQEDSSTISNVINDYIKGLVSLKDILDILYDNKLDREDVRTLLKDLLPDLLVGVACHTGSHYWTSKKSRQSVKDTLISLLKLCSCRSVLELLIGEIICYPPGQSPYTLLVINDNESDDTNNVLEREENNITEHPIIEPLVEQSFSQQSEDSSPRQPSPRQPVDSSLRQPIFPQGILKDVLLHLRHKLQKGQWKRYPNAKHTLLWCLKYLKHPHVGKYCDSFLPPLLLLLDDHEVYHKKLGLTGLSHLIRNMDSAELVQYGRANVIFDAIKSLLYFNEVDIINSLHPCFILLLPIIEGPPPRKISSPREPGKIDEVLSIFLYTMDTESKIAVRKAYSRHVSGYIELLGIYSVRYLSKLLSIITHYIEYPDYCGEETRKNCLKLLSTLMKHTWPRIPGHSGLILKSLLKLISDLCPDQTIIPSNVNDQLNLIVECLTLLSHCVPNIKVTSYKELLNTNHCGLKYCIQKTFDNLTTES